MAVDRIMEASGIEHSMVEELRWMVEDVARALVAGKDEVLAFALEGVMAKWMRFDPEPNTVQLLLRIVLREVAGIEVPRSGLVLTSKPATEGAEEEPDSGAVS
jgi:hypothetical protein